MNNPFETIDGRLSNIESLLLDLKHNPLPATTPKHQLLTIQQAAEFLQCSVPTLYAKNSKGELPGVSKMGKRLYFDKQVLIDWVKSKRQKSNEEIAAEANSELVSKKGGVQNG